MGALSRILTIVSICLLGTQGLNSQQPPANNIVYPRLTILPNLANIDRGETPLIVQLKHSRIIDCTFEALENDNYTQPNELKWTDEWGTPITNYRRQYPFIASELRILGLVVKGDEETKNLKSKKFICSAKYNEVEYKKEITIKVVDGPQWLNSDAEVTGHLGDSLEINCDSTPSIPGTQVEGTIMTFENRTHFPTRYQSPMPTRVFISPLTMDDRNALISCTAVEPVRGQGGILMSSKTVKINLLFPPVFEKDVLKAYGSIGGQVSLPCRVIDSNPSVAQYVFYAGETQINDGDKYHIDIDTRNQTATLTISNLAINDFKQDYHCRVITEDNVYSKDMKFVLLESKPTK